jgi:hypothetical protein
MNFFDFFRRTKVAPSPVTPKVAPPLVTPAPHYQVVCP